MIRKHHFKSIAFHALVTRRNAVILQRLLGSNVSNNILNLVTEAYNHRNAQTNILYKLTHGCTHIYISSNVD